VRIELVDWSHDYFVGLLKGAVPELRGGKFVQIRSQDTEYIVLAPKGLADYHAQIVERFADLRGLAGMMNRTDMHHEIYEDGWTVVGGGAWSMDESRQELSFGSESKAYGRFDRRPLEGITLGGCRVALQDSEG
jgi:hypothetical protein